MEPIAEPIPHLLGKKKERGYKIKERPQREKCQSTSHPLTLYKYYNKNFERNQVNGTRLHLSTEKLNPEGHRWSPLALNN